MRCIDRDSLLHETRELLDTTPTRLHVELFCFRQMPHASSPKYLPAISPTGGLTLTFDFDHDHAAALIMTVAMKSSPLKHPWGWLLSPSTLFIFFAILFDRCVATKHSFSTRQDTRHLIGPIGAAARRCRQIPIDDDRARGQCIQRAQGSVYDHFRVGL